MNDFTFTEKGFEDYIYWQTQDRKTLKKVNALLEDIKRNGALKGTGKPEKLKYRDGYSRRIDDANRLVYKISKFYPVKDIMKNNTNCRKSIRKIFGSLKFFL